MGAGHLHLSRRRGLINKEIFNHEPAKHLHSIAV